MSCCSAWARSRASAKRSSNEMNEISMAPFLLTLEKIPPGEGIRPWGLQEMRRKGGECLVGFLGVAAGFVRAGADGRDQPLNEDRPVRMPDDLVGDAAQEEMRQALARRCADDDQVGGQRFGAGQDLIRGAAVDDFDAGPIPLGGELFGVFAEGRHGIRRGLGDPHRGEAGDRIGDDQRDDDVEENNLRAFALGDEPDGVHEVPRRIGPIDGDQDPPQRKRGALQLRPHQQDGKERLADDGLRDAPQQQVREAASGVGAHRDEIGLERGRGPRDLLPGVAAPDPGADSLARHAPRDAVEIHLRGLLQIQVDGRRIRRGAVQMRNHMKEIHRRIGQVDPDDFVEDRFAFRSSVEGHEDPSHTSMSPRVGICYARGGIGFSSKRSAWRRAGKRPVHARTTTTVPMPPTMMALAVPHQWAVVPDSNSPSSFEALMNTIETALTRPRIRSGVPTWMRVWRTVTLSMSAAPMTKRNARDRGRLWESPRPRVASPNTATPPKSQAPIRRRRGRNAKRIAMTPAPTALALRKSPTSSDPRPKNSWATAGSSAVAPPRRTAKRSRDRAPRSRLSLKTWRIPALTARSNGSWSGAAWCRLRSRAKEMNAAAKSPAATS